jgi:hypothetical protein
VAAEPGAQFVQLQMREVELAEEAFVQGVGVLASTGQPRCDGGLSKAEDPFGSRRSSPSASAESTMAIWCEGVFRRYMGVWRRAVKVVRQAGPRKVWICSARPCLPSPTRAWTRGSVMPKYRHCWLGQAKPSVFMRLGAPRRLFTSRQGRTGADAGPPADEAVEARRQAGQSSGERGFRSRWSVARLAPPLAWAG